MNLVSTGVALSELLLCLDHVSEADTHLQVALSRLAKSAAGDAVSIQVLEASRKLLEMVERALLNQTDALNAARRVSRTNSELAKERLLRAVSPEVGTLDERHGYSTEIPDGRPRSVFVGRISPAKSPDQERLERILADPRMNGEIP